ncbi:MAG TPA: EamA family transporter, partial [Actinomycetota bacterium]|nr:EamA family transporter [Actinomycetota bacterium]
AASQGEDHDHDQPGRAGVRVSLRELRSSAIVGALLLLGGNGMVVLAERDVSSSLAALVIASVPLWVVLFRAVTGEKVSRGTLIGVAIGFAGVAVLVLPGDQPAGTTVLGMALLVFAAASWASGSFASTRLRLPQDPFLSTAMQMLCGGAWLVLAGLVTGEAGRIDVEGFSAASIFAFFYLIFAGSLAAFTAYVWLLQNAPISKVSTYAYVNPVIALLLGWIILDERLTAPMLVGAAVIVASVAFIVTHEATPRRRARGVEAPEPEPALAGAD